jgi:hypothetical protein
LLIVAPSTHCIDIDVGVVVWIFKVAGGENAVEAVGGPKGE